MIRLLAASLLAFSGYAHAEEWSCLVITICETSGDSCETDEAGLEKATLTIAPDGSAGSLRFSPGTEDEVRLSLHRLGGTASVPRFFSDQVKGSVAFLSLLTDGTLLLTVHEENAVTSWASGTEGSCTRLTS